LRNWRIAIVESQCPLRLLQLLYLQRSTLPTFNFRNDRITDGPTLQLMLQLPLSHLLHPILLIVDFGEPTNELIDAFYTMDICAQ